MIRILPNGQIQLLITSLIPFASKDYLLNQLFESLWLRILQNRISRRFILQQGPQLHSPSKRNQRRENRLLTSPGELWSTSGDQPCKSMPFLLSVGARKVSRSLGPERRGFVQASFKFSQDHKKIILTLRKLFQQ